MRILLLTDGTSDLPLARVIERAASAEPTPIEVTAVPNSLLRSAARSMTVRDRIDAAIDLGELPDVIIVHRDSEAIDPTPRMDEIAVAAKHCTFRGPVVPLVPQRMTEAYLLLDPDPIRRVAGRPSGREDLRLPPKGQVERVADAKAVLRNSLLIAAGSPSGRRRQRFERDFNLHRRQLIDGLDPAGPLRELGSWHAFVTELVAATRQVENP